MADAPLRVTSRYQGQTASGGVAHGEVYWLKDDIEYGAAPERRENGNERERFEQAIGNSARELAEILESLDDEEAAAMLEFQLAMIEDEEIQGPVLGRIDGGENAVDAWVAVLTGEISDYESSEDEYFRGRAADLRDIRDRVARHLTDGADIVIPEGRIVLAEDITPSRFLGTAWGGGGVALTRGSTSSHVAILARARNVPMVVGLGSLPGPFQGEVFLDGDAGELIFAADQVERQSLLDRMTADRLRRQEEAGYLDRAAVTPGGTAVRVLINIADPVELDGIDPGVCDGIGLVRTEFLFHGAESLPTEDEQFEVYRSIIEWSCGKPVTIRTLDAGGDKPIAGLTEQGEANPFLGVRGIRVSLSHTDVFRVQLRALLRASRYGALKIMIPMVTVPDEVDAVRRILEQEMQRLDREGRDRGEPPLGMMVEVPAAAISIEDFDVDFYSIGSNDLIQYVTACSRDSSRLDYLSRGDSPAVLKLIKQVVEHAVRAGREVGVCGEMAGDEMYIGMLVDIGVRTLSVSPGRLAKTKYALAHLDDREGA